MAGGALPPPSSKRMSTPESMREAHSIAGIASRKVELVARKVATAGSTSNS